MALQKDNTLGAPTEGLGQRVTFAFDPQSAGSQMDSGDIGGAGAVGVRGAGTVGAGGTSPELGPAQPNDPTLSMLTKLAGKAIEPMLKRAQTDAFLNGMQRAMAGEAVADIAENQPWYSTLFGESDVVEGARAYAGNTVAQTQLATMEDNMDKLRSMGPDEAKEYFNGIVNNSMTGDGPTDTSIMQGFMRGLPSVMRRQSKEHYGWQQQTAVKRMTESSLSEMERFQTAAQGYASGTITGEEWTERAANFQASLIPPAGINEKNYLESIKDLAMGAAAKGQMHVVNTMLHGTGETDLDGKRIPGIASALSEDQRRAVVQAAEAGERMAIGHYNNQHVNALAEIEFKAANFSPDYSTDDLKAEIALYNEGYHKAVGGQHPPISSAHQAALLTRSGSEMLQARVAAAREAAKEAKEAEKAGNLAMAEARASQAILNNYGRTTFNDIMKSDIDMTQAEKDRRVVGLYYAEQDPAKRDAAIVQMQIGGYVSDQLKDHRVNRVQQAILLAENGGFTPQVEQVFDEAYTLWGQSKSAASAYYNGPDHMGSKMAAYSDMLDKKVPKLVAYNSTFGKAVAPAHDLNEKDAKVAIKTITGSRTNVFGWAGANALEPGQDQTILRELGPDIKVKVGLGLDLETATKLALTNAQSNSKQRLNIVGGYSFRSAENQTDLVQYLTGTAQGPDGKPMLRPKEGEQFVGTDKPNEVFNDAIKGAVFGNKQQGRDAATHEATHISVARAPDAPIPGGKPGQGHPQFLVSYIRADGTAGYNMLDARDIPKFAKNYRDYKAQYPVMEPLLNQAPAKPAVKPSSFDAPRSALAGGIFGQ